MPACFQFALSNPVPGKEAAFNEWYGAHHLYVGVTTPGMLAGQRFQRVEGPWPAGEHEFLALWELDDPPFTLEQLALVKGTAKMPISDAVDMAGIQPPTMWIRASVRNSSRIVTDTTTRGSIVLMLCTAESNEDAAFERAMLTGGLADIVDRPGVISADFLTLADEQIRNNARKIRFGFLIELSDEAIGLQSLQGVLGSLPHLDAGRWKAPVFRPLGRRVDKEAGRQQLEADHHYSDAGREPFDQAAVIST